MASLGYRIRSLLLKQKRLEGGMGTGIMIYFNLKGEGYERDPRAGVPAPTAGGSQILLTSNLKNWVGFLASKAPTHVYTLNQIEIKNQEK